MLLSKWIDNRIDFYLDSYLAISLTALFIYKFVVLL